MGRQLRSQENGSGAVGAADDANGGSLCAGEAHADSAEERGENAHLGGSAQQQGLGVGQQGAKVGHGANAHEDQAGVQRSLDTDVEDVQQTALAHNGAVGMVGGMTFGHEVGPQLLIVQAGTGQVGQQAAESDAAQQQRLEFFHDGQVQQAAGDDNHHQVLPAALGSEAGNDGGKAGIIPQIQQNFTNINHGSPP